MKEFLGILSRGKGNLQISFTEEVRRRNPFTGHGFGTENPKRTKNGATEHKQWQKMTKTQQQQNTQKNTNIITKKLKNTINSSDKYQLCPHNLEKTARLTTNKPFRSTFAAPFAALPQHFRNMFATCSKNFRSTCAVLPNHFPKTL